MYMLYRCIAVLAAVSLLSLPLFAEITSPDDQSEVTLIVTAERTAQPLSESIASATVITAKEIRELGAETVADVLRVVPGVALRQSGQQGAAATLKARGANANQTLVLLDGQRVTSPAFIGGTDLSKFPVSEISRIEVIRGPISSLYGSEAIGGVVNIITKRPTEAGGEALLGFGGNERAERALSLHGGDDRMAWQLTGSFPAYSGTRPNSDHSGTNLSGRILLPSVKGWELSLRGERYHDSLGLPGADPNHTGYADLDDHMWWRRESLDLTGKRDVGRGQVEWRTYRVSQELHNNAPGVDWQSNPVVYDSLITGTTKATEALYRFERGAHAWIVGGEYRDEGYEDIESGAAPSTQRNTIANRALFVQDRWGIGPETNLVFGARLDDHSTAGSKITPRLGVSRAVSPDTRVRASYSEGFRAPNFVELYYPVGAWGPGYSGNPSLKPEKSRQYELGVNTVRGNDAFDIAVFTTGVRDLIAATYATPYDNIGRARQRGMEVSWDHRFSGPTRLNVTYSYIDAENRTTGQRLLGIPHSQISLTATSMVKSWEIALTGRWTDKRPDLAFDPVTWASSDVKLAARAVFDLSLTRRGGKRSNPYVVIRNLTDASYEEVAGYLVEGRSIEIGTRTPW